MALLVLAGCTRFYEPKPEITPIEAEHTISKTASVSSTYVLDRDSPYVFCTQPQPDAGFTRADSGDINVALVNVPSSSDGDGGDISQSSGETEMRGRTPSVLLARELLYRLCEFARNNRLSTEEAIALYKLNLDIIRKIASTEASKTTVSETSTLTEAEAVKENESAQSDDGDDGDDGDDDGDNNDNGNSSND